MKLFKRRQKSSDGDKDKLDYNKGFAIMETIDLSSINLGFSFIALGGLSFFINGIGDFMLLPVAITAFALSFADFYSLKPDKKKHDITIQNVLMFVSIGSIIILPPLILSIPEVKGALSDFEKPLTFIALGLTVAGNGLKRMYNLIKMNTEMANNQVQMLNEVASGYDKAIDGYETVVKQYEDQIRELKAIIEEKDKSL